MRRCCCFLIALVVLTMHGSEAAAQMKWTYLVFKDGFVVKGKIKRDTTFITDPGGANFTIPVPGGFFTVDDFVRNIIFSPGQVHDTIREETSSLGDMVQAKKTPLSVIGLPLPKTWEIPEYPEFGDNWERVLTLKTPNQPSGKLAVPQRITVLNPFLVRIDATKLDWGSYYAPQELGAETVRRLLHAHFKGKVPDEERCQQVYRFCLQAGWIDDAEKELNGILRAFPDPEKKNQRLMQALKEVRTVQWIEDTQQLPKIGQHREVIDRLEQFRQLGLDKLVDQKSILKVQDLKNKYDTLTENLKEAQRLLMLMPQHVAPQRQAFFKEASETIQKELNLDTLSRLETFVSQGQERERNLKNKKADEPRAEEVLAFAISGWLLGNGAAEKSEENAKLLWEARALVQTYLKTEDPLARKQLVSNWKGLSVDEFARLLPMLPPPDAHEELHVGIQAITVKAPGAFVRGGYQVKLPPEYHHGRSWPVLVVLHNSEETPKTTLARWQELAAENGYILMAPAWSGAGKGSAYKFSAKEHLIVLDSLRDLKRRFQVDSDRVFPLGQEQGGKAAYDIGLSHPQEFAGVLPMSATPQYYAFRYWPNAQYLPFYVTIGGQTGATAKDTRSLFKNWVRWNYPALMVEYKGRPGDWFTAETERMMKWMNCKKRAHPMKDLGRNEEEYKTMRLSDSRFYWLSTDAIQTRVLNDPAAWKPAQIAAFLQGNIFAGKDIRVKTAGVGNVTVWLGPGMLNYGEPASFHVNGGVVFTKRIITPSLAVLLEDQFARADRQRLFFARLDAKT